MIIKPRDGKDGDIATLKSLRTRVTAGSHQHSLISKELAFVRAGDQAEEEMAFLLRHDYGESKELAVINDLRIVVGDRSAQIDHLIIHNSLTIFVVETKSVSEGIRILDHGEFLRWNKYKGAYEGMASPLAQNERHIAVLQDALTPVLQGRRLVYVPVVTVSKNARILRTDAFDTSNVLTADLLDKFVRERLPSTSQQQSLSADELEKFGRTIAAWHAPIQIDYAAKFGIKEPQASSPPPTWRSSPHPVVGNNRAPIERGSTYVRPIPRRRSRTRVVGAAFLLIAMVVIGSRMTRDAVQPAPPPGKAAASGVATKPQRPPGQQAQIRIVPAALAGDLGEGERCFEQKRYDCAISSANAVLRIEPGNKRAKNLKRQAEQEQAQAMRAITIR